MRALRLESLWMAIPDRVKEDAEKVLSEYCREKIPEKYRDQIKIKYKVWGKKYTIYESRPLFMDHDKWSELAVVQCRYNPETEKWSLHWADRNSRWHPYDLLDPSPRLQTLLDEIDRDPTGIFWG